jgi:hypothetical protein
MDFFDFLPEQSVAFVPPKKLADDDFMIREEIPEFDSIIGNLPYIRQELIEKRVPGTKKKIANVITLDWNDAYRDISPNGNLHLSGQADIYAYLFFHAGRFLKDGGRLGIVSSNSWLDVA